VTDVPSRDELAKLLEAGRITGDVATDRESNTGNIRRMLARETNYDFGLSLDRGWSYEQVVGLMAERVGIDPDPERTAGADTISTESCLDALDRMAETLAEVASRRGSVLLATGHPTGLLVVHQGIARALRAAGCEVLTPADGERVPIEDRPVSVLYVGDVGVLASRAHLLHTHRPEPMRTALAALGSRPDLVVADHGWAGAAGEAGVRTVGFADCNDPALFVGAAEGKLEVVVPLDDNVVPSRYAPMTAYLLRHL
jgi:hypothetical protein